MQETAEEAEDDPESLAAVTAEKITLEQALRDIANSVIADADVAVAFTDSPRNSALDKLAESMEGHGSPRYYF